MANVLIALVNTIVLLIILVINVFVGVKIIQNIIVMMQLDNVIAHQNIMDIVANSIL
jgi:hypothetical protein